MLSNCLDVWVMAVFWAFVVDFSVGSPAELFTFCANRKENFANVLHVMAAHSVVECAAFCKDKTGCRSASYREKEHTCLMFPNTYGQGKCDYLEADVNKHFVYMKSPCEYDRDFENGTCPNLKKDCVGVSGLKWIDIYPDDGQGSIRVLCWRVYLVAAAVPQNGWTAPYTNRTWNDYKYGFGDVNTGGYAIGGYWLGNENIYRITHTSNRGYKLGYTFESQSGDKFFGWYYNCVIQNETYKYSFNFSSYETIQNVDQVIADGSMFRATDYNDNGCAASQGFGFWYSNSCSLKHTFNGQAYRIGLPVVFRNLWIEIVRQ